MPQTDGAPEPMKQLSTRSLLCLGWRALFIWVLWFSLSADGLASGTNPPSITVQPVGGIAGTNEDFVLSVEASGTQPLSYQWFFHDFSSTTLVALQGATNAVLLLTNLVVGNGGFYSVLVTNSFGSTNSFEARLSVTTSVPRRLGTGRIVKVGSQVGVPITFRANGRETNVSFSLRYTNTYTSPTFAPANSAAVVTTTVTPSNAVGVSVSLPAGQTFPAGDHWLGLLQFNGTDALQGRLAFTTNPVPVAAVNSNGTGLMISAAVQPQFVLASGSRGQLSFQSGLFEEKMTISNPSETVMTNLDILALRLGFDSQTNIISFFNSQDTLTSFPFGDPLISSPCDCGCGFFQDTTNNPCSFSVYLDCGATNDCSLNFTGLAPLFRFAQINNLAPGASTTVTLEFYVSDHVTVPQPSYSLFLADPPLLRLPPFNTAPFTITTNRFVNGTFLIEFGTLLDRFYYVQYAATTDALQTNALTVLPPVRGTGSRVQWTDNGPPKTASPPTNGSRFYRVLETQ